METLSRIDLDRWGHLFPRKYDEAVYTYAQCSVDNGALSPLSSLLSPISSQLQRKIIISSREDGEIHLEIFRWFGSYLLWQHNEVAIGPDTAEVRRANVVR